MTKRSLLGALALLLAATTLAQTPTLVGGGSGSAGRGTELQPFFWHRGTLQSLLLSKECRLHAMLKKKVRQSTSQFTFASTVYE